MHMPEHAHTLLDGKVGDERHPKLNRAGTGVDLSAVPTIERHNYAGSSCVKKKSAKHKKASGGKEKSKKAEPEKPGVKRSQSREGGGRKPIVVATETLSEEDRKVGNYQMMERIGKGGFGSVYRGLNCLNGMTVAVKRVDLRALSRNELDDVEMEFKLLEYLSHPNIVRYYANIRCGGYLHIILEYCENGALTSLLSKFGGRPPEALIAHYISDVLTGLAYLHEQGVIHRDIKGANLLTDKAGSVKLTDFGISKKLSDIRQNSEDEILGTPYWMAPEIFKFQHQGAACDIWSLGCTIIEVITGNPPFHDMHWAAAIHRICSDEDLPLPEGISDALADFLRDCFQKDPDLRLTATDLLQHQWIRMHAKERELSEGKKTAQEEPEMKLVASSQPDDLDFGDDDNEDLKHKVDEKNLDSFQENEEEDDDWGDIENVDLKLPVHTAKQQNESNAVLFIDCEDDSGAANAISRVRRQYKSCLQTILKEIRGLSRPTSIRPTEIPAHAVRKVWGIVQNKFMGKPATPAEAEKDNVVSEDVVETIKKLCAQAKDLLASVSEADEASLLDCSVEVLIDCMRGTLDMDRTALNPEVLALVINLFHSVFLSGLDAAQLHVKQPKGQHRLVRSDRHNRVLSLMSKFQNAEQQSKPSMEAQNKTKSAERQKTHSPTAPSPKDASRSLNPVPLVRQPSKSSQSSGELLAASLKASQKAQQAKERAMMACAHGILPLTFDFVKSNHPNNVRLEAARLLRFFCLHERQSFIACGGLQCSQHILDVAHVGGGGEELLIVGFEVIESLIECKTAPYPSSDDAIQIMSKTSTMINIAAALTNLTTGSTPPNATTQIKAAHLLTIFANHGKEVLGRMCETRLVQQLIVCLEKLKGQQLLLLTRTINAMALEPQGITLYSSPRCIKLLVGHLRDSLEPNAPAEEAKNIVKEVLNTLFSLCRLPSSIHTLEQAAMAGIIPCLKTLSNSNPLQRELATIIMLNLGKVNNVNVRLQLQESNGAIYFLELLEDRSFGMQALEALTNWLLSDDQNYLEAVIAKTENIKRLISRLHTATEDVRCFENVTGQFSAIVRHSTVVCRALYEYDDNAFVKELKAGLSLYSQQTLVVALLDLLEQISNKHHEIGTFVEANDLREVIRTVMSNPTTHAVAQGKAERLNLRFQIVMAVRRNLSGANANTLKVSIKERIQRKSAMMAAGEIPSSKTAPCSIGRDESKPASQEPSLEPVDKTSNHVIAKLEISHTLPPRDRSPARKDQKAPRLRTSS